MFKKIMITCIGLLLILSVAACTSSKPTVQTPVQDPVQTNPQLAPSPAPQPAVLKPKQPSNQLIQAKWIEPEVNGTSVSIPLSEVESNWNTHFKIQVNGSTENFMAYSQNGTIHVRANVCPPCRSIGFSLYNDILICDTCQTQFRAGDGFGIKGACVDFPKAAVQYKVVDGNIVMNQTDLVNAYQDTLQAG